MTKRITTMLYLGRRYPRSSGYYREAGEVLLLLKAQQPQAWIEIARTCGLTRSRAYELTVLGGQKKTLAELRAEASARKRKHRESKRLPTIRGGQRQPKSRG